MNIDVKAIAGKIAHSTPHSDEFTKREELQRAKAMSYLKAKFPDADEKVFRTDYTGTIHEDVLRFWAVAQAADIDETCTSCKGTCTLPDDLKARNSRPVIRLAESPRGFSFLDIGWTCGLACRYQPLSGEFGRMFKKSGIKTSYAQMTFKAYQNTTTASETSKAKLAAWKASQDNSCLILAGKPGTGKTHLAVAIALRAMEHGQQAIFRLVSAMLDEIQSAITDKGDYDGLMRQFKTVPCLVLDDLGHENMTAARASYLHQIIDYRYCESLQTIITTNAKDIKELCAWSKEEYVMPIVSRILGRGAWVTITNAPDRRLNHGK